VRPAIVVDCINTATAFAYQNVFDTWRALRARGAQGSVPGPRVETLLASLYLPQLIRHVQIALEAMRRAGTGCYVKVGTAGTGGMGLNIPFTHSEERPSRMLLAKASIAGALAAALPDGAHAGRAGGEGDQADGGDQLEADRVRRGPRAAADPCSASMRRSPCRSSTRSRRRPRYRTSTWASRSRACSWMPARTACSAWASSRR
jgi:hypothetical protein